KKVVRKQGGATETTVYVGAIFEHQRDSASGVETDTVHVLDNRARVATVRAGPPMPGDASPAVKYVFADHLGSSNVVIDDAGAWVNREEYLPYGETSFGSFAKKRYRFTGCERDAESGFSHHGARSYAVWLARWTSPDPLPEGHG